MDVTDKLDAVHDDPVADAVIQTIVTAGVGSLVRAGIGLASGIADILTSSAAEDATIAGASAIPAQLIRGQQFEADACKSWG